MKKITALLAIFGATFFAHAQVGIGTATPDLSSILDIKASDKGVLIPRVELSTTKDFFKGGTPSESLLVYNTLTTEGVNRVTPGFYYWSTQDNGHWERITNQSQLDQASTKTKKIEELLQYVYPSNALSEDNIVGQQAGGGMIFSIDKNGVSTIEYVFYDGESYQKVDVTDSISNLIKGSQDQTLLVASTNKKWTYFVSELYLSHVDSAIVTSNSFQETVDLWRPSELPLGVYYIDMPNAVINNIEEIFTTEKQISITQGEVSLTFNSVQQYIEYLSSHANLAAGTVSATLNEESGTVEFKIADGKGGNSAITVAAFQAIVKLNESQTLITKTREGVGDAGTIEISYDYFNESSDKDTPQATISLHSDVAALIQGNTLIKNAILEVTKQGGNVYYGDHDDNKATPDAFFTVTSEGNLLLPISDIVVHALNQSSEEHKNSIRKVLGNQISAGNSFYTGDSYKEGGTEYYVYRGEFTTTVLKQTAQTTGFDVDHNIGKIITLQLSYNGGLTASVNDLIIIENKVSFNIGEGLFYKVLGSDDITAKVILEYSSTANPFAVGDR